MVQLRRRRRRTPNPQQGYLFDGEQKRNGQDEQETELEEELAGDGVQHLVVHGVHEARVERDVELRVPVRIGDNTRTDAEAEADMRYLSGKRGLPAEGVTEKIATDASGDTTA